MPLASTPFPVLSRARSLQRCSSTISVSRGNRNPVSKRTHLARVRLTLPGGRRFPEASTSKPRSARSTRKRKLYPVRGRAVFLARPCLSLTVKRCEGSSRNLANSSLSFPSVSETDCFICPLLHDSAIEARLRFSPITRDKPDACRGRRKYQNPTEKPLSILRLFRLEAILRLP